MFTSIRRWFQQFFNRSRTINNEPLNKVSIVVIVLIDIFILTHVFAGLQEISTWHLSPSQAYPCYREWKDYRQSTEPNRAFDKIKRSLMNSSRKSFNLEDTYRQAATNQLGEVSEICLKYARYQDQINHQNNQKKLELIQQKQEQISQLEKENRTIRSQYDSTLLEKIAGQKRAQSINNVSAEKAQAQIESNQRKITNLQQETEAQKKQLLNINTNISFLNFLNNKTQFNLVENGYQKASFWHPMIQLLFQLLFLIPLILFALGIYLFAQSKGYGLIELITWHLLIIFFIPLIFKIFEFIQLDVILNFLLNTIRKILGRLSFLVRYIYILLVPLLGFGIIKLSQIFIFNRKNQITNRFQKMRCLHCAKKIRSQDVYCPHCGYHQYTECSHCHRLTYKELGYCKKCGHPQ